VGIPAPNDPHGASKALLQRLAPDLIRLGGGSTGASAAELSLSRATRHRVRFQEWLQLQRTAAKGSVPDLSLLAWPDRSRGNASKNRTEQLTMNFAKG
jgi:hypothetical protein